ncbi:MAG TPA: HAD family hydrolase [Methylotenera sp.]|nr:HAD family hydrolase [Methylotenera sp.]HPH06261.1 HAD family hydrolase [Methylotenera sp.]HPN00393.1 HAD family hydrolase [Methylotenera sp.]
MNQKKQNLALFDLDNTLLAGDSDFQWGQFMIAQGLLDKAAHHDRNVQFHEDYKQGKLDIDAFLKFQLHPLSQHKHAFLNEVHLKYMQQIIRPMMTKKARALVEKHRAQGDLLLVITATNSFITRPIALEFGIENLIGTDPEEINGEFTGNYVGVPSFQTGKVTRLNQWLAERGKTLDDFEVSYFYSDSHNDLPLMQLVTNPVAVDADATLSAYATQQHWPHISLR